MSMEILAFVKSRCANSLQLVMVWRYCKIQFVEVIKVSMIQAIRQEGSQQTLFPTIFRRSFVHIL